VFSDLIRILIEERRWKFLVMGSGLLPENGRFQQKVGESRGS